MTNDTGKKVITEDSAGNEREVEIIGGKSPERVGAKIISGNGSAQERPVKIVEQGQVRS